MKKKEGKNWFTKRGFVRSCYQLLTLVCLLAFVSWLYNGSANRRYVQRVFIPVDSQYDIVAFGDSLIEGLGASNGNGFVSILSQRLGEPILNAGKRRETTASAIARVETDVLPYQPKLVIVSIGGNDVIRGIPVEDRLSNLRTIVFNIQSTGARVILLAPQTDLWSDRYRSNVMQFAAENNIAYVPNILDGILFNPKYLFDLVHPNDKGHQLIADRIEPVVRSVWNQIQAEEMLDK